MRSVAAIGLIAAVWLSTSTVEVARPLAAGVAESIDQQRLSPDYLVPADSLTAAVVDSLARQRGFSLDPPIPPGYCPWSRAKGPKGYGVRITVDSVMGDSAIASYVLSCSGPDLRGAFATGATAQLHREHGRWVISKWLDRWIT